MKKNWMVSSFLFLIVGTVAFHYYQMQRLEKDLRDIRTLPKELGEWKARDISVSDHDYDILETRNLVLRKYENKKGEPVDLFLIYSETNRRVCHPPVVCLIGSGITVTKTTKTTLSVAGKTFTVNRLIAGTGKEEQLVLYWYLLGKEFTDDYFTQQTRWVMNQAMGKGVGGGAMIRIITPIAGNEEEALERAKQFIGELIPEVLNVHQHVELIRQKKKGLS